MEKMIAKAPGVLVRVYLKGDEVEKVTLAAAENFVCEFVGKSPSLEKEILLWLKNFAQGKHLPPTFLKLEEMNFTDRAVLVLTRIPFGKTASYQEIAKALGQEKAARAVGNACKNNLFPLFVPCHRVLQTGGGLGGFAFGLKLKQSLLTFERNYHHPFA